MRLDEIHDHLRSLGGPAGRVDVFEAARAMAVELLDRRSIEATEEGSALAAVAVLANVAGDVLGILVDRCGLPIGHVLRDLEYVRDLALNVGRLEGLMPSDQLARRTST